MKSEQMDYIIKLIEMSNKEKRRNKRVTVICMFVCFLLILSLYYLGTLIIPNRYSYTVNYSLNNHTKEYIDQVESGLKNEYLINVKKITYEDNFNILNPNGVVNEKWMLGREHVGNIIVYITGNLTDDRNTLCHELLHVLLVRTDEERYTYGMADKEVCYEN